MDEKDFERIEELLTRKLDQQSIAFDKKLDARLRAVDDRFDALDNKLDTRLRAVDDKLDAFDNKLNLFDNKLNVFDNKLDQVSKDLGGKIEESERRTGVLLEVLSHKLDLVIEGQQGQVERLDRVELELKGEDAKADRRITSLSADLYAHKADPDAHRGNYRVKESDEEFE